MRSPLDTLTDRIRAAQAHGTPLRIRGGGTKDFYGDALHGELLSTADLTGITSYEPSELVVTVLAGTPLAQLEAELAAAGQCLPFEPPHFGPNATVGGMVAAGLSGPARASAGSVRDYVLGATMVNGKGEQLTFGGQVMKNVAGYDVSRLLAGSLGTLGLIGEVSLKVLPVAPAEATLKFIMDEAQALQCLNTWGGQPLPLNAGTWLMDCAQPTLYLRLRGAVAAVQTACTRLLAQVPGQQLDTAQAQIDWNATREQSLSWFNDGRARGQDLWRLSVPQTAGPLALGDTLVEWLGGQRWIWADPGDAKVAQHLRTVATKAGGHATLFVAALAYSTRPTGRFTPLKSPLDGIHRALKAQFDPAGILNRGRMYADF